MKRKCSISLANETMHTKRQHCSLTRKGKEFNDTTKHWQGCAVMGTLILYWGEYKLAQLLWRAVGHHLLNLTICLHYYQGIPLLENENMCERKTCARAFICSSVYNIQAGNNINIHQKNNMHRMEYYIAIRTSYCHTQP